MNGEGSQEPKRIRVEPEDTIKVFGNIIPSEIEKELKKLLKDNAKAEEFIKAKIQPLIDSYEAKIFSPKLPLEEEQILWMHTVTKGIINKEIVVRWVITDLRAIVSTPQGKYYIGKDASFPSTVRIVGLALCDTVVMNQHRKSSGSRVGTFTGVGGRTFAGTGVSSSSSTSSTYGDLVFLHNGKEVFRFFGISDPNGVRKMIETIKKQTKV